MFTSSEIPAKPSRSLLRRVMLSFGFLIALLAFGLVDYGFLRRDHQNILATQRDTAVSSAQVQLSAALEEAISEVKALGGLVASSENVDQDELQTFVERTTGRRINVAAAYGFVPFSNEQSILYVGDLAFASVLKRADVVAKARSLIGVAARSEVGLAGSIKGGILPGMADNPDLFTVFIRPERVSADAPLMGLYFITYSVRRLLSLPDFPAGTVTTQAEVSAVGGNLPLWSVPVEPALFDPVMIEAPIGPYDLRMQIQGPQISFSDHILEQRLESQLALLAVIAVALITLRLNVNQIRQGRRAAAAARKSAQEAELAGHQKTRFLATMSHEMRTPLNGIIGMADLLMGTTLTDSQRKNVSTLSSSAQNLLALINQILDFSKIEAKEVKLDPHPTKLADLLANVSGAINVLAADKGVELVTELPLQACVVVNADSTKLRQILTNLLSNAIKFTSTGSVTLKVERVAEERGHARFRFSVRDTGIGIDEARIKSIFEPFQQADISTTRNYGGTGLGLTITLELIQAMGSKIEVTSELGKGSVFAFELELDILDEALPLRRERCVVGIQNILIAMPPSTRREAAVTAIRSAGGELVVADDLGSCEQMMQVAVKRGEPIDLVLVADGAAAKEMRQRLQPMAEIAPKVGILRSSTLANVAASHEEQAHSNLMVNAPHTAITLTREIAKAFHHRNFSKAVEDSGAAEVRATFEGLRVLLIDDDRVNQYYGTSLFERLQCRVVSAWDGKEAVEAYGSGAEFDVVFMDCQMPIMDGLEATRQIQRKISNGESRARPIVALTANTQAEDRQACFEAGMQEFLSKPVRQPELIELLTRLFPEALSLVRVEETDEAAEGLEVVDEAHDLDDFSLPDLDEEPGASPVDTTVALPPEARVPEVAAPEAAVREAILPEATAPEPAKPEPAKPVAATPEPAAPVAAERLEARPETATAAAPPPRVEPVMAPAPKPPEVVPAASSAAPAPRPAPSAAVPSRPAAAAVTPAPAAAAIKAAPAPAAAAQPAPKPQAAGAAPAVKPAPQAAAPQPAAAKPAVAPAPAAKAPPAPAAPQAAAQPAPAKAPAAQAPKPQAPAPMPQAPAAAKPPVAPAPIAQAPIAQAPAAAPKPAPAAAAPAAKPAIAPAAAPKAAPAAAQAAPKADAAPVALVGLDQVTAAAAPSVASAPSPEDRPVYKPDAEILSAATMRETKEMLGANFGKLMQTFIDATPSRLAAMDFDIDSRNYEEVRRNAHSLKSSAKMVGAMALSESALKLEAEARKPSPNRLDALAYSAAMQSAFRGFIDILRSQKKSGQAA